MGTFTVLSVIKPGFYIQEYSLLFLILKAVTTNPINCTTQTACWDFNYLGTKEIL